MKDTRISLLFEENNVNISELSRKTGIPYGTLYDIAKGKTRSEKVPVGTFIKIARAFGMTVDELFSDKPDDGRFELLNIYDSLGVYGKRALLACGRGFASNGIS